MARAVQKRTLETRSRLIAAAQEIIAQNGFEAMRVDEVVLRAGTAKGTFFAHFDDKDALMDLIIGARIDEHLNSLQEISAPKSPKKMAELLMPLCDFMACERYVFDVILRYSGAAKVEKIGAIANTFGRQVEILEYWLSKHKFRNDISVELQAEGIQAFMIQAIALKFCALHTTQSPQERLTSYLAAWLMPVCNE